MMRAIVIACTGLLLLGVPAHASPQDDANYISQHIMSPFCTGVTLHDCPSDSAVALRNRITEMADDGFTRAQIIDELVSEYGETILAEPPRTGSGLLAWLLPAAAALGAAALAWTLLRRWVQDPEPVNGYDPDTHVTPADERRLDAELEKLRGPA